MQPRGRFERQLALVLLAVVVWVAPQLVPPIGTAILSASQPVQQVYAVLAIVMGVLAALIVIYWAAIYLSTGR